MSLVLELTLYRSSVKVSCYVNLIFEASKPNPTNYVLQTIFFTFVTFLTLLIGSWAWALASTSFATPVEFSVLWAICYFTHAIYVLFVFSAVLYVISNLPTLGLLSSDNGVATPTRSTFIEGLDLLKVLATPVILILLNHSVWVSPSAYLWFNHVAFSTFQWSWTFVLFFFYTTFLMGFSCTSHYSSTNAYDFSITLMNFFFWAWVMFFSNNLFTFIFFLELLAVSITLMIVTSTFSSASFYNNLSYSTHSYFTNSTPGAFLQTLMFFFWSTLVTSLMLFLMLLVFYTRFLTLDWTLINVIAVYLTSLSSLKELFTLSFSWLLFVTCIFMKCGIVPFYLWKPAFFRGMNLAALFFYTYVYYFAIFLYVLFVLLTYMNELFFFNLYILVWFLVLATLGLMNILFEPFYFKSFIAVSSILNSVLVLYGVATIQSVDLLFIV